MPYASVASSLRAFFTSTWGIALVVSIGWQIVLTCLGQLLDIRYGTTGGQTLAHTLRWDGAWYVSIVNGAYETNGAAPVFYPLFPFAVYLLYTLSLGAIGIDAAGLVVNTISTWLALVALTKIAEFYVDGKKRWLPAVIFLASPAAFFLHLFYVEAVFCAVAFWAFLFALRRQWHWMGAVLALTTAAKLPALLFVGLCGLEFMRAYDWKIKKILNPNILWFLLAPLGFVAYGLYLHVIRGDFLAMFHGYDATDDWSYHQFNPNFLETLYNLTKDLVHLAVGNIPLASIHLVNLVLPLLGLFIVGALSVYALFASKKTIPLGIFGLVTIVFLTLNSNVISVHRYLLPCLVVYITVTMLVARIKAAYLALGGVILACMLLQLYLLTLFISGGFAG